ncbi:hypothetical protein PMAYCL1PPCAC_06211, partial [Pristionchus mayeri]
MDQYLFVTLLLLSILPSTSASYSSGNDPTLWVVLVHILLTGVLLWTCCKCCVAICDEGPGQEQQINRTNAQSHLTRSGDGIVIEDDYPRQPMRSPERQLGRVHDRMEDRKAEGRVH